MATLPIETERLRIHHLAADDWHAVDAYTIDPGEMTKEQTNQFIAGSMADEAQAYAVDHRAEERLIGHIGFHPWFDSLIFEIGWVFHPRYHGQGYATEATAALLQYGFESLQIQRVIAKCQPENTPSQRAIEKLGMQREAHFRKCIYRDERWWDEYLCALLEEEWFRA